MDFSNYIFRSHMVGNIISVPKPLTPNQAETLADYRKRQAGEGRPLTDNQLKTWHSLEHKHNESQTYKLTDTAKRICTQLAMDEIQGISSQLNNKYFDKGIEKEKEARDLLSMVLGKAFVKDDERRTNEFVTGKRDIKDNNVIIDIKTAWNRDSFNKHLLENPNEIYLRQLDCYMELFDIKDSLLAHVLVDTPFKLVDDEIRREDWRSNITDMNGDIRDEFVDGVVKLIKSHIFTRKGLEEYCNQSANIKIEWFGDYQGIPVEQRIHMISHQFDPVRITQRNECIKLAREFMNTIKPINCIIK